MIYHIQISLEDKQGVIKNLVDSGLFATIFSLSKTLKDDNLCSIAVLPQWKYKIDDILKEYSDPLSSNQVVNYILEKEPGLRQKITTVKRSVSSALSLHSAAGRYHKKTEKGVRYYWINKEFKE